LFFCGNLLAQKAGGEIIVEEPITYEQATDTLISTEPEEDYTVDTEPSEVYNSEEVIDSNLVFTNLFLRNDSLYNLTSNKKYNWIKNIDSLLKEKEKKDKVPDTTDSDYKEPKSSSFNLENFFNSGIAKFILYALAALFVGFIIYSLFVNKAKFGTAEKQTVAVNNEEETIDLSNDYEALAQQAKERGNYKLAVRYLFLATLKQLNEKQQLVFAIDKTNSKYTEEIAVQYKQEFSKLCLYYEYVWYGNAAINGDNYEMVKTAFNNFNQKI
jgi:hypothetical protein